MTNTSCLPNHPPISLIENHISTLHLILFCFIGHTQKCQGLFLVVHSGMTLGRLTRPNVMPGVVPKLTRCKGIAKTLYYCSASCILYFKKKKKNNIIMSMSDDEGTDRCCMLTVHPSASKMMS